MRLRHRVAVLLCAVLLTACSSTQPPSTSQSAPSTSALAAPSSAMPAATTTAEGPITSSMAALNIGGERYAALGDPSAPITVIEYSDFG